MQTLRNTHVLARIVLAWFALSLGVAIASPVVKPQGVQWVCSAAGQVFLQPADSADAPSTGSHLLDCPLCVATGLAPRVATHLARAALPLPTAAQPGDCPAKQVSAAPPPGRGPPVLA